MGNNIVKKIHEYVDAIIGNGLYDFIKKVLGLCVGGTTTTAVASMTIDNANISFLYEYKVIIVIIITLIVIMIILELYSKNYKHRPTTPDVVGNYDVLKRVVAFTYGKECSQYEVDLTVKSNINGLNRIQGKYTWSGSEPATITCGTKHCRIIPLTRKDSFIEYEVELGKRYKKGDKVDCKIIGSMPDSKYTFIPFFSTRITEKTEELIINICIPPEYGVREIICEEIAIVRNSNESSREELLNDDGRYQWVIKSPKLFYVYSVRWEL
ncbi:MAG: hypothetical protein IJF07_00175 [Lachnospiraceae bacterium]|nr:hypothetical protein [Lachnospiraceae bacterium]